MIKFSATNALVHSVTPVIEIESRSGGQPFCKRELIIDDSWDKDGKHYANFVSIEFTGDKMAQLDSVYPGMRVNVDGLLSGREYNNRIYNSVRGQSVSPYQAQQQSAPAPAPCLSVILSNRSISRLPAIKQLPCLVAILNSLPLLLIHSNLNSMHHNPRRRPRPWRLRHSSHTVNHPRRV
ncbi:DUF3127 domain-containing protein [Duncaniella sp. C9]|uniref:DUF3127 domain-containing protein n=1 Tax=Duncaniella sp. C9 TaxID=2530392 RepID=UPI0010A4814D|nr:DUF3127 domain-containing protein [Duncaniella sp. C9]QCD39671.1 DUF3127 domain-containing protein [Duncaniella sp. C9]